MGLFSCFSKPAPASPQPTAPIPEQQPSKKSVKFAEEVANPLQSGPTSALRTPPPASGSGRTPVPAIKLSSVEKQLNSSPYATTEPQLAHDAAADVDAPASRTADQKHKLSGGGAAPPSVSPRHKTKQQSGGGAMPPPSPRITRTPQGVHADTACVSDSPSRWATSEAVKNLVMTAQGPASFAAALRPYTEEATDHPVQQYIVMLGKHGAGLVEAANNYPDVGYIFGAAFRLHKCATSMIANQENAIMLAGLGQDVVRALDVAGKRGGVPVEALEGLLQQLEDAYDMVDVFSKDGWLLHMLLNEHIKAIFDRKHNAIADALEAAELEVPGKAAPLPRGAYLDVNRNLRRTLKRLGGGSVAQGVKTIGVDPLSAGVREVASQLGVSEEAVCKELAALPSDVPIEAYYSRMVLRQDSNAANPVTERYMPIFTWYDRDNRGYLTRNALHDVLADLGVFDGLKPAEVEAAAARAFSLADQDADGRVSPDEFARYYDTLTCTNARKHLRLAMGLQVEDELKQIFNDFCSFGTRQAVDEMDNAHFVKLMKDCDLIGTRLTVTDVDLAFTKAKPKGSRKLGFDGFLMALAECAERKGVELEDCVRAVLACQGPIARATKADAVRLHDDKSTYTGVYAKGGPKVAQKGTDLGTMLDRSGPESARKAPVRGVRTNITIVEKPLEKSPAQVQPAPGGMAGMALSMRLSIGNGLRLSTGNGRLSGTWKRRSMGSGVHAMADMGSPLYEMWLMWAQFGTGSAQSAAGPEMGVTQFIKMMRETGMLDKGFTAVNAELLFMRVKSKGATKISFTEFDKALQMVAESKGLSKEAVEGMIVESDGPLVNAYKA